MSTPLLFLYFTFFFRLLHSSLFIFILIISPFLLTRRKLPTLPPFFSPCQPFSSLSILLFSSSSSFLSLYFYPDYLPPFLFFSHLGVSCPPIAGDGVLEVHGDSVGLGTTITFSCPLGYYLNGAGQLTCLPSGELLRMTPGPSGGEMKVFRNGSRR